MNDGLKVVLHVIQVPPRHDSSFTSLPKHSGGVLGVHQHKLFDFAVFFHLPFEGFVLESAMEFRHGALDELLSRGMSSRHGSRYLTRDHRNVGMSSTYSWVGQ